MIAWESHRVKSSVHIFVNALSTLNGQLFFWKTSYCRVRSFQFDNQQDAQKNKPSCPLARNVICSSEIWRKRQIWQFHVICCPLVDYKKKVQVNREERCDERDSRSAWRVECTTSRTENCHQRIRFDIQTKKRLWVYRVVWCLCGWLRQRSRLASEPHATLIRFGIITTEG